jgi:hypothetical protein
MTNEPEVETFDAPGGFDPTRWRDYRNEVGSFALHMIDQIEGDGFTERQAGSVVAHILLEMAWACAAAGALSEGKSAKPERFMDAAQAAINRVNIGVVTSNDQDKP